MRARLLAVTLLAACAGRWPSAPGVARAVPALPGLPALAPTCRVANHVHTQVSDVYSHDPSPANARRAYSPAGLRAAIAAFDRDGVDAIVVTDHNSTHARFDPAVAAAPRTVIPGMEWTTRRGHALLVGFRAADAGDVPRPPPWRAPVRRGDFLAMVAGTHVRGGLVFVAHPRVPLRTWPDDTFGADGVEVWGLDEFFMRNRQALRWWHGRLVRGERLVAVGGTDLHPGAVIRRHRHPLLRVHAPTCDAGAVLAGLRAGHVQVVRDVGSPVIVLGLEAGGALDFAEGEAGDAVALHGRDEVDLQLRVVGGAGARLRVLGPAGELHAHTVAAPDEALRLRVRARPGEFVRAELHRGRRLLGLTNPLYFR